MFLECITILFSYYENNVEVDYYIDNLFDVNIKYL